MSELNHTENNIKKQKNMLARQRIVAIVLVFSIVLLAIGLFAAKKIVDNLPIEFSDPSDGTLYHIKKVNGEYALVDTDGNMCDITEDGYYVTRNGTLVLIDKSSGQYTIDNGRELLFPQLYYNAYNSQGTALYDKSRIVDRIDVTNIHGSYAFLRSNLNNFVLEGHEDVQFSSESFAYLMSSCTYPLSIMKLENPKKLENGEINFAEYGLAEEKRYENTVDNDGNETVNEYDYFPAHAKLTLADGKSIDLYFGDATVTGSSYYVRCSEREGIYILASSGIGDYIIKSVESVISPSIVYPMSSSTYVNVENFIIYQDIDYKTIFLLMQEKFGDFNRDFATDEEIEEYDEYYKEVFEKNSKKICHFSFQDLSERENSLYAALPYVSFLDYSQGYYINSTSVSQMLKNLYETEFVGTIKLSPSESELEKYGLKNPDKVMTFTYLDTDEEGNDAPVYNKVSISSQNSDGSYYAYSEMYDMIVCVDESSFNFLSWSELEWYDPSYMQFNINHIKDITVESPQTDKIRFDLDKSATQDGTFLPITENKFDNGGDISYEIKKDDGLFGIFEDGKKLQSIYKSDYLITGIPYSNGTPQSDNFLLCEVESKDTDNDGTTDTYIYYYYNITYKDSKYVLYASVVAVDANGGQSSSGQSVLLDVAYTSDCFVTNGFSQYAFLIPQNSSVGEQLTSTYEKAGKGEWFEGNIYVTAKGSYIIVNPKTANWATLSAVANNIYIADKNSGKLQASGVNVSSHGVLETVYANTGEVLSYNSETNMLQLYNKATGERRNAKKSEVAPGVWGSGEFYVTADGDLLTVSSDTGDAGLIQLSTNKFIASVYANGKELNYSYSTTDSLGNTESHLAIYNFQQLYMAMLYGSFEGECTLTEEEMEQYRSLDNFTSNETGNPCILKITVNAEDLKGNSMTLVYRFYKFSERRAYITIESVDENGVSNSANAHGKFYTISSYAEKIISDVQKVLNGIEVESNGKY